jgi:hypothetical protein
VLLLDDNSCDVAAARPQFQQCATRRHVTGRE